jgi:hypothetical protein
VLDAQVAETPAGKPLAPETPLFEIPVAPTVACVISVKAVLIHKVGAELAAAAVLLAFTVTTVAALVAVHKLAFVCITVYEPDVVNDAFLPDAPLLHTYDPAELADDLKVTVPPIQKVVVPDKTEIVGVAGKA